MSVRRDAPRGPTSEQLRRRALAHEQRANTERATAAAEVEPSHDDDDDPTAGLPADLASLLRDPRILVPQDAGVFELIASWMNAPSDTASA